MSTDPIEVAIHPDDSGPTNSSSPRWTSHLRAAGVRVRTVDVFRHDVLHQVAGCEGFMWRFGHGSADPEVARRVFPVLEHGLGMHCYPNQSTRWHFDDKVAQALLLDAHRLPAPETRVFFRREEAEEYLRTARWPQVVKLAGGAGSANVRLARSRAEAEEYLRLMFGRGTLGLPLPSNLPRTFRETRKRLGTLARAFGLRAKGKHDYWIPQRNYLLLQEFLPDNAFDTRVTVIGNRAFAFRRFNRPGDFRSSGSGLINHDPQAIDLETVQLAFETARRLGTQSCAIDGLRRGQERVIGEISYAYMSNAVQACSGHWDDKLTWHEGHMWPEDAQAADFLEVLRARRRAAGRPEGG